MFRRPRGSSVGHPSFLAHILGHRCTPTCLFLSNIVRFLSKYRLSRRPVSTRGVIHATNQLMVSRITVSLALVAALIVASERSASPACVLVNAPSQKACARACCSNKCCCETSQKRTEAPVQPLATPGSHQENFVALTAVVSNGHVFQLRATEIPGFSIAEHLRHSPATLTLICIRLI